MHGARKPARHWLQFSLRSFFIVVSAVALWLSVVVAHARRQREIVAAVVERGGSARWKLYAPWWPEPISAWMYRSLGPEYATIVRGVALKRRSAAGLRQVSSQPSAVDDETLALVAELGTITSLDVSRSMVTDFGLQRLHQYRELIDLDLSETSISDAGLRNLAGLCGLEGVNLAKTRVTDAGLANLAGRRLIELNLAHTLVTGRGFVGAALPESCLSLSVRGCPVDDDGLRTIVALPDLLFLDLAETHVTDAGMAYLARVRDGCHVCLYGTSITDAGLRLLHGRSGQLLLTVTNTGVTDQGIADLSEALPDCVVVAD